MVHCGYTIGYTEEDAMPDLKTYNTGNGLNSPTDTPERSQKKMSDEEAQAVITLVRGGWLKLELTDPAR